MIPEFDRLTRIAQKVITALEALVPTQVVAKTLVAIWDTIETCAQAPPFCGRARDGQEIRHRRVPGVLRLVAFHDTWMESGHAEYRERVLSKGPARRSRRPWSGSRCWRDHARAVRPAPRDLRHRHQLTHELLKFIVDPDVDL